ncbi:MAG: ParB/RepB/Spo0J family partition protein [Lachnospiraceae bacterium]|nr:ParB/RepB/Spo0J family partition protein [Lachnospiraceae bacterium]
MATKTTKKTTAKATTKTASTKATAKAAAKTSAKNTVAKEAPVKKTASKFGLGKGMGALIPTSEPIAAPKAEKPVKETVIVNAETMVNINLIEPNPNQPRKKFDEDALGELAESIKLHGLIQPILVQKKDKMYQIIAGERRWRACRLAKLKEVPVIVKELSENEQYEVALIENIQREDLNDIEEAYAYKALIEEFNLKQDEVAERVSKSRVAVTNSLRLLKLDNRVQNLVVNGLITGGHARALLGITDGNLQYDTATRIIDEKLSVRETEKLVKQLTNHTERTVRKRLADSDAVYSQYEENLRSILGSRVEIKQNGQNKGKIVIEFSSADEFEKIFDIIKR